MDIERDKRRIQALDKGADGLSKQIRVLKKKSEEIVNLIHELSSGYKKHIHDSDALLVHFQVCENRANSLRMNSIGESNHNELTKAHVVITQVLKSYLIWVERSKHRRENHVHSLQSIEKFIHHSLLKTEKSILQQSQNHGNIEKASNKQEEEEENSHSNNNNNNNNGMSSSTISNYNEKVDNYTTINGNSIVNTNDVDTNEIHNADKIHNLEKQLIEKSMEAKTWKNICESLRVEMGTLKTVVDSLSNETSFMQSEKVSQAEKEVKEWQGRCKDMQAEMWDLKTKLKSVQLDSHGFKQSSARAHILQSEVETLKEEVERSKIALAETCSRSKYNELVAAFEQAQVEKDRLALELVGAMSERDQLKQEKERAQWQESQANEIAVMEMQGYLEAERVKVTGLSKRLNQGKKDLEKHLQKYEKLEKNSNLEMEKLERLNRKLHLEKNTSILEHAKMQSKFERTLNTLKVRFTVRWVDLTKSQTFRSWCQFVANMRSMKARANVAEQFLMKHEKYCNKMYFSKWKMFTDTRSRARRLVQNLFTNAKRRKFFQAYRQWHRQVILMNKELTHQETNIEKAHRILIKFQSQKYRKILQVWHRYAYSMAKKKRVIKLFFTSTYRRTIMKGWRPWVDKNQNYPLEKKIINSQMLMSNYTQKQRVENKMRRVLNIWHRYTNKNMRLRQLMKTHLIKWEGHYKSKALSFWKYKIRKSRRKRQTIIRLMFKYRKMRFRYAFTKLKRDAFRNMINMTKDLGEARIILSYQTKRDRNMEVKTFHNWSKYVKKKINKKKSLKRMIKRMQKIRRQVSFSRWKLFSNYDIIVKGLELHKLNVAENHSKSFNLRLRRLSFKNWKLFAMKSINSKNMLMNCLDRRETSLMRSNLNTWIIQSKKRNKMRRCVRRMRNVIFKQGYVLAMSKWKAEVQRIKVEDALCLGHSAMRKTKYDMAKRIFGRLRRSRLYQAFKQWKLDTRDERENEEKTHAIEAMSNWAARVAGGRVLKERFGLWFAFTRQNILQKIIKETTLRNALLRMWKLKLNRGFHKWVSTVEHMRIRENEDTYSKRTKELEAIIKSNDDFQQSKRHHALLNAVDLFHGRSTNNLKRKIFFAWRFVHTHQLHENKIAKQHEKHEAQRRRSIQIAVDSLFFNKEKYNLQETFAKLKQFCLHMKSKKSFIRSLLLQYKCTKPIGQAFAKWRLTTRLSIAHSQQAELLEKNRADVAFLTEKLELIKQEEEIKQEEIKGRLENALLGWTTRRNKGLIVKVFHRWVHYLSLMRYEKMSSELKQKIDEEKERNGELVEEKMEMENTLDKQLKNVDDSPPTPPPPPPLASVGGRNTLFQHTEMLERENETLNKQVTMMQEEIDRLSSTVAGGQTRFDKNNESLMTLESLATDPSPFLEQDLQDLRKDNDALQTELTNTQRKLFKAKERIREVSAGTKEKEKVLLLQENLTVLDKKKTDLENQVSSLQLDLQDAYKRIEKLEKDVKRYRNAALRSQQKSETDRLRVRQYEQRLKQEHENVLAERKSSDHLEYELKQMSSLYNRAVNDLEETKIYEQSLKQTILEERRTSHALAQKLQLSAQEIHHLLDENERLQTNYMSRGSGRSNEDDSHSSPTPRSFPQHIDIDDLQNSTSVSNISKSSIGQNEDHDNTNSMKKSLNYSSTSSPSSAFKKSLAAQVQLAMKNDESLMNESLSSLSTNDESMHLYRDGKGRIFGRDSPERERGVPQNYNNKDDSNDDEDGDDFVNNDAIASNVSLAEGLVQMKSTESGNVITTFKLRKEDKKGRFQSWK